MKTAGIRYLEKGFELWIVYGAHHPFIRAIFSYTVILTEKHEKSKSIINTVFNSFLIPKASGEQLETIKFWMNLAVETAEMIYLGKGKGVEKKAYVEQHLSEKGFRLDTREIDSLIKAAVLELKIAAKGKEEA